MRKRKEPINNNDIHQDKPSNKKIKNEIYLFFMFNIIMIIECEKNSFVYSYKPKIQN